MLKLEDIKVGDFVKINDFKALGIKAMFFTGSPIKESYKVCSVHLSEGDDDKGAIAVIIDTLEDGRQPCGVIFEEELHAIELVKNEKVNVAELINKSECTYKI